MGETPCRAPPEPAARLASLFRFEGAACAPVPAVDHRRRGFRPRRLLWTCTLPRRLAGVVRVCPGAHHRRSSSSARAAGALRTACPLRTAE